MPTEPHLALLRLLQLVSPSLPVGGFTYSQGIEWAVECGWIQTDTDLENWLADQLENNVARLDLPVLLRLSEAVEHDDQSAMHIWNTFLLACRETAELRLEETNRGRALADLLMKLELPESAQWKPTLAETQLASFAFAANRWQIPLEQTLLGYTWGWLENLVLAAVKIIPLGQTQGQQVLQRLSPIIPELLPVTEQLNDDEIGASNPALAIASSLHETQYTRLFRS
ncbi:MAG: urease accessory UreF family protein [Gammaproteobacteria bacterium]|nr:urease accessory UreF family protein [Gammaproteobacteria bacterium]